MTKPANVGEFSNQDAGKSIGGVAPEITCFFSIFWLFVKKYTFVAARLRTVRSSHQYSRHGQANKTAIRFVTQRTPFYILFLRKYRLQIQWHAECREIVQAKQFARSEERRVG